MCDSFTNCPHQIWIGPSLSCLHSENIFETRRNCSGEYWWFFGCSQRSNWKQQRTLWLRPVFPAGCQERFKHQFSQQYNQLGRQFARQSFRWRNPDDWFVDSTGSKSIAWRVSVDSAQFTGFERVSTESNCAERCDKYDVLPLARISFTRQALPLRQRKSFEQKWIEVGFMWFIDGVVCSPWSIVC